MYTKTQISLSELFGTRASRRKGLFSLLSFFIVMVLLLGSSSPVFATTPEDTSHGESKKAELVLRVPWGDDTQYALANGSLYGKDLHSDAYNQFYAIDFNLQPNNSWLLVYPARSGNVFYAGWINKLGNTVVIRHDIGDDRYYYTLYAHLKEIYVTSGEFIRDAAIGREGNTGGDFSPHLHFAVFSCDRNSLDISELFVFSGRCKSVIPEPLIGREVYEGFGMNNTFSPTTKLYGADPGSDTPSGAPGARWSPDAISDNQVIGPGLPANTVNFAIEGLPDDTKEVRFTAWYDNDNDSSNNSDPNDNWSTMIGDGYRQNWRILARCWPDNHLPNNCSWGTRLDESETVVTTLKYIWDPYNDPLGFVDPNSQQQNNLVAPWLPAGTAIHPAYRPNSVNYMCISFDIFDNAGNVSYAPSGTQCSAIAPSVADPAESVLADTTDLSRLIYVNPVYSQSTDNTLPSGSWTIPGNGQTITSNMVTLSVNASDNDGGSGVREVRWAAKYNGQWYGIGTDYDAPYFVTWDWCAAGAQDGDVELGFEVWDNANNKWVYGEHAPAGNIHINKNYSCSTGTSGSIGWSTHFYSGMDHWLDPNNTNNQMCSGSFSQANLDKNYGSGSPCGSGATDNWVGDYKATVNFQAGNYAFWVDHDDWLKLRIDGREVYSVNGVHGEWKCVDNDYLYLSGNHDIWVILAEQAGDARVKVEWSRNNGVCDPPDAFNKSNPLSGLGGQPINLLLNWAAARGASSYSYCVDATDNNSCDGNWLNTDSATSISISGLDPATTYYWEVRAYSQGGAGTEANGGVWWSFTTQANPPAAFDTVGPVDPAAVQSIDVTALTWGGNGASWYQYCYDTTDNSACDNDMWYSAGTDTSTSIINLVENTTYYWQVRASNGGGTTYANNGAWSSFATQTFADVAPSYWAGSFIERLFNNGITGGCSTNPLRYCPNAAVTRAQMAVFLLSAEHGIGYVPADATGTAFNDVPASDGFARWIEQLAAEGITGGCGGGNYCPNAPVTREQMAVFLLVAKHGNTYTPPSATGIFTDVPASNGFAPWIEALAAEGITGGCGGDNFCPKTVVNRAQMAVFLVTAFNLP
jgi:hypothetical protein